eukprot:CAMPEP_0118920786 /NCGR_PEP_ID=MMETSP1169-20130426/220_1 /TAXON_ID=36882 /ORGANISM="Pyramimonas obovata, Strain CCMP722" /LENGTH=55 /DNA_ID=CAMNT_0006861377 /DNA_START=18 /DNA_END=183 /DNA_ORIENTATION=-
MAWMGTPGSASNWKLLSVSATSASAFRLCVVDMAWMGTPGSASNWKLLSVSATSA